MSETPMVTLDCLLGRLEDILGADSLLFRRFQRGLQREEEAALTEAMDTLLLYPFETRREVEDAVMNWLFGSRKAQMKPQRHASPR